MLTKCQEEEEEEVEVTRICHRQSTMMDTLPRVPDVNGVVDEKLYSDLYTRTSWVDASIALDQIEKVRP